MNLIATVLLLLSSLINTTPSEPVELLFIQWGSKQERVNYREDPAMRFGPQSFCINDSRIKILDPVNNSLKVFESGQLVKTYYAPANAKDFAIKENGEIAFLIGKDVHLYSGEKRIQKYINQSKFASIKELKTLNGQILLRNHSGNLQKLNNDKVVSLNKRVPGQVEDYSVQLLSKKSARFKYKKAETVINFDLQHADNNLGAIRFIGKDTKEHLYFDVDLIVREVPLKVNRQIWITDHSGKKLGLIHIPSHYYTSIHNDIEFAQEGRIYHMLATKEGIYLYKWEIPENIKSGFEGYYPEKVQEDLHFNRFEKQSEQSLEKKSENQDAGVSRDAALQIADSYVQHQWNCKAENLTNGIVTAPDDYKIDTPNWIDIGENQKVPYKWGGFNTLSQFDNGLADGKYAGDTYTSKCCGSSYARGVDCSGYVSRCWQLSSHYATSMMGSWNKVQNYSTWDDLKPADAILKAGSHVILFVQHNANGSLGCVEAAAGNTGWKVDYNNHYPYQLSGYSPVYYVNMEDILATPQNIRILNQNDTTITVKCDQVPGATEYVVYYGTDGETYPDSVVSPTTQINISDLDNLTGYYFKIRARGAERKSVLSPHCYAAIPSENANRTLIVNGFDRSTNSRHDYIKKYMQPMLEAGQGFSYVLNESVYKGHISLTAFDNVIWILGDESSVDDTFNPAEQDSVENFLNKGGNLFVSGAEIGWDLEGKSGHPTQADKNFYHKYLKAKYVTDAPDNSQGGYYSADAITGSIFEGLETINFDDGSHGTINVDWPDAIEAINGSESCMKFKDFSTSKGVAGIYFEGDFPQSNRPGKLVYLTFPFETVYPQASRNALLQKVIEFFNNDVPIQKGELVEVPRKFELSQNYPNPFNPTTKISYQLPEPGFVDLAMYDINGRLVETLVKQNKSAGEYTISWHARDISSGMYLYKIKIYNSNKSKLLYNANNKCILLK